MNYHLPVGLTNRASAATASAIALERRRKLPDRSGAFVPPEKRLFISSTLLCVGAMAAGSALQPGVAWGANTNASKMNIILCMTDDQGWGDVGYNGHSVLKTPHLDQMAREGLRFDRWYAGAPVCSPTRGSCLTGRHPYRYGIFFANVGFMKKPEITLAEVLKSQGYTTGHFGKWHLGSMTKTGKDGHRGENSEVYSPPWDNGFDVCFSTESKVPTWWYPGVYDTFGARYWTGPEQAVPTEEINGDDSKLIMDRALPFIRQAAGSKTPFLSVIWFHAPHAPVSCGPPYTDMYTTNQSYYGCLTAMDEQMGRLRKELKTLGIEENTMLWFSSDNGPEGNESAPGETKFRGRKRSLYEGGVRVPGLLVWPARIKEHRIVTVPCSTSDYFPTVLEALGYRLPEASTRPYDGVSLLPLIDGKMSQRPKPVAFESAKQLALVDNQYKIYRKDEQSSYELYDLVADPQEKTNLAEKHPKVLADMIATLEDWRRSCAKSNLGQDYGPTEHSKTGTTAAGD